MNRNSNNIFTSVVKIAILLLIIIIPLLIVVNYEAWKLGLEDIELIRKDVDDLRNIVQERKRVNEELILNLNKEIRKNVL
jgi:hypothetical protein